MVRLPEAKKRTHDDKPVANANEKTTVKVHRKLEYPPLDNVLPNFAKKTGKVASKPPKRRNEYFYLMRSKYLTYSIYFLYKKIVLHL